MLVRYEENGRIVEHITICSVKFVEWALNHEELNYLQVPEGFDQSNIMNKYYISNGEFILRPEIDAPDNVVLNVGESLILDNIPENFNVDFDGQYITDIQDTKLEIEGNMPANYQIMIERWPYIEKIIKVTVQ